LIFFKSEFKSSGKISCFLVDPFREEVLSLPNSDEFQKRQTLATIIMVGTKRRPML
jgi:hypothetical protein